MKRLLFKYRELFKYYKTVVLDNKMLEFPNINPIIISFGPCAISWYSLSYVIGILLGWLYALQILKYDDHSKISPKNLEDFVSWAILGIVIGGRLGYVIFYDPIRYLSRPMDILKTYMGGMSFHGGMVGYIVATAIFTQRNKLNFIALLDLSAATAPIGLFLGRIANFIKPELYGRTTDVYWSFVFPGSDGLPRHPSQLYEAVLEGILLFVILLYAIKKLNALSSRGMLFSLFLIFYSVFRIIVEFFREPDMHIGLLLGGFTIGQLLSLPMMIIGFYFLYISSKNGNRFGH